MPATSPLIVQLFEELCPELSVPTDCVRESEVAVPAGNAPNCNETLLTESPLAVTVAVRVTVSPSEIASSELMLTERLAAHAVPIMATSANRIISSFFIQSLQQAFRLTSLQSFRIASAVHRLYLRQLQGNSLSPGDCRN